MESFDHLGLSAPILKAIGQLGFETPTEIQNQAIPVLLEGNRDFIGLAQTGTGKTAAFGLPLLDLLDPKESHVQALILAPTRELGQQIAQQMALFAGNIKGLKTVAVYGGANISEQMRQLRGPCQVVIATPGRLIDLAKRKALKLDQIKYLVLDEADEMLNMGFKEELDTILEFTPDTKQTWLFSATMPREIRRLVKEYMEDPFEVRIDPGTSVNVNIEHQYALVRHTDKFEAMCRFLDLDPDLYGVVFCRTKRDTQNLAEDLLKEGYRADALHGDLSQHQRDRVMQRFKRRELQVLIATDVAARGIDVNDLTHVFHHSLPDDKAYYTHRSGRTARAGKKGVSLAFINKKEKGHINRFSRDLDISMEQILVPDATTIVQTRLKNWATELRDQPAAVGIASEHLELVDEQLADLTREELIARLVAGEMKRLNLDSKTDLNKRANAEPDKPYRKEGFSRGGYGGRSGGYGNRRDSDSRGGSGGYGGSGGSGRSGGSGGSGGYKKKEGFTKKWNSDGDDRPKRSDSPGSFPKKESYGQRISSDRPGSFPKKESYGKKRSSDRPSSDSSSKSGSSSGGRPSFGLKRNKRS